MTFNNFPNNVAENKKQDCAAFDKPPDKYIWNDVACRTYKFCVPCQYKEPVILKMRGLCEEDEQATNFIPFIIDDMNKYSFK